MTPVIRDFIPNGIWLRRIMTKKEALERYPKAFVLKQPKSEAGQIWQCHDTPSGETKRDNIYMVVADRKDQIIGEVWLVTGEFSDSRGHSEGKPDRFQEFYCGSWNWASLPKVEIDDPSEEQVKRLISGKWVDDECSNTDLAKKEGAE